MDERNVEKAILVIGVMVGGVFLSEGIQKFLAIAATKIPILRDEGFWSMAHASRTDWSMPFGCLFLMITGPWPLDARRAGARPDRP